MTLKIFLFQELADTPSSLKEKVLDDDDAWCKVVATIFS